MYLASGGGELLARGDAGIGDEVTRAQFIEGGNHSFDFYCDIKNTVFSPTGWTTTN